MGGAGSAWCGRHNHVRRRSHPPTRIVMAAPMLVLQANTKRDSGRKAQIGNIAAAKVSLDARNAVEARRAGANGHETCAKGRRWCRRWPWKHVQARSRDVETSQEMHEGRGSCVGIDGDGLTKEEKGCCSGRATCVDWWLTRGMDARRFRTSSAPRWDRVRC